MAAALVVLVAEHPRWGCAAWTSRRAACARAHRAGHPELTLATDRDVPWNGPFYASEGFVEVGPADAWYAERGRPPEEPVLVRPGAGVLMSRRR